MTFLLLAIQLLLSLAQPALANSSTEIIAVVPRLLTATIGVNSRYEECSLGSVVADAVRIGLASDIAIVCGGELAGNQLPGEATFDEIMNVFTEDRTLAVTRVTVKELRLILEAGLSHISLDESESIDGDLSPYDGFPQISGFVLYYDASAPPGSRIYDLLIGGERVGLDSNERILTLASTGHMLTGGYGMPAARDVKVSEKTLFSETLQYINDGLPEYSPSQTRINVRGVNDGGLVARFFLPLGILLALCLIFVAGYLSKSKDRRKPEDIENTPWY